MFTQVKDIDVADVEDGLPALLTMILMPLTYDITVGIGAGFISWVLIKVVRGKVGRDPPADVGGLDRCSSSSSCRPGSSTLHRDAGRPDRVTLATHGRRPRRPGRRPSIPATIARDVRTDRAARRAARDQRPASRGALGLDRRLRPRRLAPRDRRPGRRRPLHGAPHVQGHDRATRRPARSPRRSRASAARSTPPPTASRPSTGSASRAARPTRAMDVLGELIVRPRLDDGRDRQRADGHHRGDPLATSTTRPSTARSCSSRRCSATAPLGREICGDEADIRALPGGGDPRLLAAHATGRPTRSSRSPATSATTRRVGLAATAFGTGQRRDPGLRAGAGAARPARACCTGKRDTTPGPARASASRRSAATIPTAGRSRSSTRSSATG